MPFFLLLDSFWLLFPAPAPAAGAALSAAVPSVLAVSVAAAAPGAAGSVEFAALPSPFVVAVPLELSLVPEVVSSAPAGFAGAGSPGLTVSTTAVELDELPPPDDTSVVRFPPLNVSVGPLSDSGSI